MWADRSVCNDAFSLLHLTLSMWAVLNCSVTKHKLLFHTSVSSGGNFFTGVTAELGFIITSESV